MSSCSLQGLRGNGARQSARNLSVSAVDRPSKDLSLCFSLSLSPRLSLSVIHFQDVLQMFCRVRRVFSCPFLSHVGHTEFGHTTIQAQSGHTLDREEILRRVRSDASAMRRAESHLLCCQQFVLEAARLNVAAVQYSPLGDDHTFMLFLVERMAEALSHASEALRADWHFVMNCVVRNPLSLSFAPSRFRRDRAFLLGVVKRCPMAFTFAPEDSVCTRILHHDTLERRWSLFPSFVSMCLSVVL